MRADQLKVPADLAGFLGNRHVVQILGRAIAQGRLPHALIFAGPAGVGKCTLAILLAQRLNCLSPEPRGACGLCAVCRKTLAVLQARYLTCLSPKGEIPCGGCMNCRVIADQHPDVRLIRIPPDKTTISIEQVREMISEISYQPFEARLRVVILDPAEQMDPKAHNSLLKTLEEPASRTAIILVTTKPHVLLQTIRSRSRTLHFGGIPEEQIAEYLVTREGRPREEAVLAAAFSHGSLSTAIAFDTETYREIRRTALSFVASLLERGSFKDASGIAAALLKDKKDKDTFGVWLDAVDSLLQDVYFLGVAPQKLRHRDLREELSGLAAASGRRQVVSAIERLKKLRLALQRNVNRQIALEAVFLEEIGPR
jgi:DNA polymerase-3 subunit delta'